MTLEYGKNKGLSTVFFESIFQDSDIYEKFGYLKYNNDCTLICVIEGDGYSEVLVESIEKHILKYGKTNQINTKIVYTHSENKKITNYKNVTIFALGY